MIVAALILRLLPLLLSSTQQLENLIPECVNPTVCQSRIDMLLNNAEVEVHSFPVYGETPEDLRDYLRKNGPTGREGGHYDAYTEWEIRWKWPLQNGVPILEKVNVSSSISVYLPEWESNRPSSDPLRVSWEKYLKAVRLHEAGHVRQALWHKKQVERVLKSQASAEKALNPSQANKLAGNVIRQARFADQLYDFLTRHGASQGAQWPPRVH